MRKFDLKFAGIVGGSFLTVGLIGVLLYGCGGRVDVDESIDSEGATYCEEIDYRDVVCTQEYAPVCGIDGLIYSNGCQACVAGIESYVAGECEDVETGINIDNQEACERANGDWRMWSRLDYASGQESCNVLADDVGKECGDSRDCEGVCYAVSDLDGECSRYRRTQGCYAEWWNGDVQEICVD